jgi:hypothetical protein
MRALAKVIEISFCDSLRFKSFRSSSFSPQEIYGQETKHLPAFSAPLKNNGGLRLSGACHPLHSQRA